ncbi:MAG: hypothetical protein HY954_09195 [Deltaproteobacteria bacterium]|nr:hypothetical protein [Deltaproteobacteria bacterium]
MKFSSMTGKKEVYVWDRVPLYEKVWKDAATELGAVFIELEKGFWKVTLGGRSTLICNHRVQIDDQVTLEMASHKPLCYELMKKKGLRIPEYAVYSLGDIDIAADFIEKNKGPFVVKPAMGTSAGMGVTTHISTFKECVGASALASLYSERLMIERLVPGESYRLLVLNGRMIHASRRRGVRLTGDGRSTLRQLMSNAGFKNRAWRGNSDRDLSATLQAQGLSEESIPSPGLGVLIKSIPDSRNIELRTVYDENVTNHICQEIALQGERAAEALNSNFCGIDIITLDHTAPLEKTLGAVIEINTTPGLQHHYGLAFGDETSPAVEVLEYLLNSEAKNRSAAMSARR